MPGVPPSTFCAIVTNHASTAAGVTIKSPVHACVIQHGNYRGTQMIEKLHSAQKYEAKNYFLQDEGFVQICTTRKHMYISLLVVAHKYAL